MRLLHRVASMLDWIWRRGRAERQLDAELRAFVDLAAADKMRDGATAADARRQALVELGGLDQVKEHVRFGRHGGRVETAVRADVRAALRRLHRSPALSATIVALLGLTIGSAAVIFSIVNAVLLRPLPFGDPSRIALVWETRTNTSENVVGGHEFPEWVRSNHAFDALSAMIYDQGVHLTGAGDPLSLLGVRVSASFFRVMGVTPAVGRAFSADEDSPGHGGVAVLSDRLWRSRFNADPAIVGRVVQLDDRPFEVVGVMPGSFTFPPISPGITPDIWTPIAENVETYVGRHYLFVVGRVRPGVTMAQAQQDLAGVAHTLEQRYPNDSRGHGVSVVSLRESLVKHLRPSLLLLFGAVGCLLLIGCSNVASLLMARGLARRREIALELAMGATRGRLARQLIAESLALSIAGGLAGLALAALLIRIVPSLLPPDSLTVDAISIDRVVLAFSIGLSTITGLLFGVAPALQIRHVQPIDTIKEGGRSLVGGHTRVRRVLVTAQVALAVLLVLGASLMIRGLVALRAVDPGFVTQGTLAVDLSLRGAAYRTPSQQRAFFDAVESRIQHLPGVQSVGSVNNVPIAGGTSGIGLEIDNRASEHGLGDGAQYRIVTPGYFKTIGVPFVSGRDFKASDARLSLPLIRWFPQQPLPPDFDRSQAIPVAIVNETMARRFWPDGAVDRRFKVLFSPWITVIGVVKDMRTVSLQATTGPEFYLTATQEPQSTMTLLARASGSTDALVPVLRSAIWSVDAALPIASIRPMDDVMDTAFGQPRFMSVLLGSFAAMALALLTVGVYGLLAFTTAQRLPELGVRIALGATRRQIHRLILRDALLMTIAGIAAGVLAALALGRVIADQLFGVTPTDPPTFVLVVGIVLAIVGLACWRPVRRAGRVDAVSVLREQ
jgi:predicted permease